MRTDAHTSPCLANNNPSSFLQDPIHHAKFLALTGEMDPYYRRAIAMARG